MSCPLFASRASPTICHPTGLNMYAAKSVGIDVFDSSLGANEYVFGPFSTQQLLMKHASAMAARASNNPAPRCSPGRRTCERCVTHSAN